jgi:hypothetical protein
MGRRTTAVAALVARDPVGNVGEVSCHMRNNTALCTTIQAG